MAAFLQHCSAGSYMFLYRPGYRGMLPVHMAAMNGHLECFKKLVALMPNFNVDCADESGRTCLHAAACGGSAFQFVLFIVRLFTKRADALGQSE